MRVFGTSGWVLIPATWLAGALPGSAAVPDWVERLAVRIVPEIRVIDDELAGIERELPTLPAPAGASSGVRRGFQTGSTAGDEDLWVEVALPKAAVADTVVLVPLLAKGSRGQVPGFGFPRRFQVEGFDDEGESLLLLDRGGDDFPNPGLNPVSVGCPPDFKLARVRLTAIEPWAQGGPRVLALAEILILRGNRNLATGGRVSASSSRDIPPTWSRSNLLDMDTPLGLPIAPTGASKSGWHSEVATTGDQRKSVTVDLGRINKIDQIRLLPASRRKMAVSLQYGFPSRFVVETSTSEDFSDRRIVYDRTDRSLQSPGQNLQCYEVGHRPVRFVRVTTTRLRERTGDYVFALGELQAYAGGRNVALGAAVIADESLENDEWGRAGLTDGLSGGGRVLELPMWFRGLDRSRVLEERRKELLTRRGEVLVEAEQTLVGGSICATCAIALLAGWISLRSRRQRRIDREQHRERLARDLHDELGSNLGSIALISSFALEGDSDESQMRSDLAEIEQVARESADSMRDIVDMLGGKRGSAADDWLGVLEGMAERLMRGVELDCRLPDGVLASKPDLETRREIYLFCKEVLHNAARHAGADSLRFHLRSLPGGLRIEIADNGCGFDPKVVSDGQGLGNLRERAARLRATMNLESSPGTGTLVTLDVPRGRRWRKPTAQKKS